MRGAIMEYEVLLGKAVLADFDALAKDNKPLLKQAFSLLDQLGDPKWEKRHAHILKGGIKEIAARFAEGEISFFYVLEEQTIYVHSFLKKFDLASPSALELILAEQASRIQQLETAVSTLTKRLAALKKEKASHWKQSKTAADPVFHVAKAAFKKAPVKRKMKA